MMISDWCWNVPFFYHGQSLSLHSASCPKLLVPEIFERSIWSGLNHCQLMVVCCLPNPFEIRNRNPYLNILYNFLKLNSSIKKIYPVIIWIMPYQFNSTAI